MLRLHPNQFPVECFSTQEKTICRPFSWLDEVGHSSEGYDRVCFRRILQVFFPPTYNILINFLSMQLKWPKTSIVSGNGSNICKVLHILIWSEFETPLNFKFLIKLLTYWLISMFKTWFSIHKITGLYVVTPIHLQKLTA